MNNYLINTLTTLATKEVQLPPHSNRTNNTMEFDKKEFAKLIILECAEICAEDYVKCNESGRGWYLSNKILEHFGMDNQ